MLITTHTLINARYKFESLLHTSKNLAYFSMTVDYVRGMGTTELLAGSVSRLSAAITWVPPNTNRTPPSATHRSNTTEVHQ